MYEKIQHLLSLAVQAPSGDNCQPWLFHWSEPVLQIENQADRDTSLYNSRQRGSLIANGALIENISILAPTLGLKIIQIQYFPDPARPHGVASLRFQNISPVDARLRDAVSKRSTNRKRWKTDSLTQNTLKAIRKASDSKEGKILICDQTSQIKKIAEEVAKNEDVLFGNKSMHQLFFGMIQWNPYTGEQGTIGLPIKTLEIPSTGMPVFKLMRSYEKTSILRFFGITNVIVKENVKTYASCGAMVALTITKDSDQSMIELGRRFQKIWLEATYADLQVQPLMGIIFLHSYILDGNPILLTTKQQALITHAYTALKTLFRVPQHHELGAILRMGYGDDPSERVLRDQPVIVSDF